MVPLGLVTATLIATDRKTGDEIGKFDRPVNASRVVSYAGSAYTNGAVAAAFYIVGRKRNDARARETGILAAEALLNSMIVEGGLKWITQRVRPLDGTERSEFFEGGTSFPSGHATHVWSVATVVANEYHDRRLVKVAAYGIAGAVSVSRVTRHKHYMSDVLVGSVLGYLIGEYVYRRHHRDSSFAFGQPENDASSRWPSIAPRYERSSRAYGIGLTWTLK